MKVTLKEQVNIIKGIIKNAYTEAKMIIQSWTESNSRHSETCLQS
jgi:hypothetical protein